MWQEAGFKFILFCCSTNPTDHWPVTDAQKAQVHWKHRVLVHQVNQGRVCSWTTIVSFLLKARFPDISLYGKMFIWSKENLCFPSRPPNFFSLWMLQGSSAPSISYLLPGPWLLGTSAPSCPAVTAHRHCSITINALKKRACRKQRDVAAHNFFLQENGLEKPDKPIAGRNVNRYRNSSKNSLKELKCFLCLYTFPFALANVWASSEFLFLPQSYWTNQCFQTETVYNLGLLN